MPASPALRSGLPRHGNAVRCGFGTRSLLLSQMLPGVAVCESWMDNPGRDWTATGEMYSCLMPMINAVPPPGRKSLSD